MDVSEWAGAASVIIVFIVGGVMEMVSRSRKSEQESAIAQIASKLETSIAQVEADLTKQINAGRMDLADFRTKVAVDYASVQYLKDVEERLIAAVREMKDEFSQMRKDMMGLLSDRRSPHEGESRR